MLLLPLKLLIFLIWLEPYTTVLVHKKKICSPQLVQIFHGKRKGKPGRAPAVGTVLLQRSWQVVRYEAKILPEKSLEDGCEQSPDSPDIPQQRLGVCDPEFYFLPFYTFFPSIAQPWWHIPVLGETSPPHHSCAFITHPALHSACCSCFWVSFLLTHSPLLLRIPFSSESPPSMETQLGNSYHKLCWLIQGVLLLLSPFIFQSWGFHSLADWFAVTPYSPTAAGIMAHLGDTKFQTWA